MALPRSKRLSDHPMAAQLQTKLTLKDVAHAMGVSRTTVSNAFNRPEQLSEGLRDDILGKARELGYFGPDPKARALRRREVHEVGVVFHHDLSYAMSDPSSIDFLRGVSKELDARHLTLQLIPKMGRKLMLEAAFQTTADAMIVHADIGPELVPELLAARKPVVLVDSVVPGFASVGIQDRLGASLAMQHALAARPDVVVVLGFPPPLDVRVDMVARSNPPASSYVGTERMAGYAVGMHKAKFAAERVLWVSIDDWQPESAAEQINGVRGRLPSGARVAIVAMSDRVALAAQRAVRLWRGVKVVAIVGFDDIPAAAAAGLTTVRQASMHKGELCVQVLLDGAKPRQLPVELVVRDT